MIQKHTKYSHKALTELLKVVSYIVFILLFFTGCENVDSTSKSKIASSPLSETTKKEQINPVILTEETVAVQKSMESELWSKKYRNYSYETISNLEYSHKNYAPLLKKFNGINKYDQQVLVKDSLKIPTFHVLLQDTSMELNQLIPDELILIIEARNIFMQYAFIEFARVDGDRNKRVVPLDVKSDLLKASKAMAQCVSLLKKREPIPKSAIGQFNQVKEYLFEVANGDIDENGYVLDLIHQRLGHGLKNLLKWEVELEHFE